MKPPSPRARLLTAAAAALAVLAAAGCSSYAPLPAAAEPVAIAVRPVINESALPQVIAPLARNLRERLAHSPRWELVAEDAAEASLQVTVLSVERIGMARDPQDTGRPLSFNEIVRVSVEWISDLPPPWGDDPVVVVESDQLLYAQPSLVDAESVAMAELADRLAGRILQQLEWTGSGR